MIKATKTHKIIGETTKIGTEVLVEGNGIDILFEFMGILDAMEREYPEVLLKAIKNAYEGKAIKNAYEGKL